MTLHVGMDGTRWKIHLVSKKVLLRALRAQAIKPVYGYTEWTERDFEECRRQNSLYSSPNKAPRLVPYCLTPLQGQAGTG